ncbi:hypothetical protein [Paenibacillus sp. YN15]|uniref:hypothetical protein n=1 Tax=Paenibacillus sp. YN15 TaxID=1742774 RepID=UPI000DCBB273|nr:hypothetical protein [Paenibacillus sp. YN15]RAU98935.1 hypothetical protein DQG13_16925 [Paenibacillus sp. YN15]
MIGKVDVLMKPALNDILLSSSDLKAINGKLHSITGIRDFFQSADELEEFKSLDMERIVQGEREFGDFQTPSHLASQVCHYLLAHYQINPAVVIEPTFGKGNFIRSAIECFPKLRKVYAVEIQKNYHWLSKQALFHQAEALNRTWEKPDIQLFHDDIFTHSFDRALFNPQEEILILGNPPWVTNSELGSLDSKNLPKKQNFKEHKGLDALTGKSNFDICEYIMLMMLETFKNCNGTFAMLCKNSVAKKLVQDLPKKNFHITDMKLLNIDAKKDFNAAADASLFVARLGGKADKIVCDTYKLDEPDHKVSTFGWHNHKFVSNIEKYKHSSMIDHCCQFTWRSGIKHDCSSVMELDFAEGRLTNKLKEAVEIEDALVFDLLKSSDLKTSVITESPRKKVIVTQKSIGEETAPIERDFPNTWRYLTNHKKQFEARKSSIYKGKPDFSIFGVGDYSFSAYKVAISGMYKKSAFTLVPPINGKAVMLDDTCYFLPFDDMKTASFTFAVLNGSIVQDFLQSVVFLDEKRPYTKDILMRIDLYKAAQNTTFEEIKAVFDVIKVESEEIASLTPDDYQQYMELLKGQALLL